MKPVTVYMITYNHGKYIQQAIESIISQKTNFGFELLIGEDISTDNTYAICKEYADKYPDIINLLPSDKKYGATGNGMRTLRACNRKYIAFCEGDDYWIDPYKLQKQYDFLEANPDFSICFSDVQIVDELGHNLEHKYPRKDTDVYTIEDVILSQSNIMPTPTLFCRNVLPNPLPQFLVDSKLSGDIFLQIIIADKGKIKYFPEESAAYRNHAGGITKNKELTVGVPEDLFNTLIKANAYFDYKYNKAFRKRLLETSKINLIFGSKDLKGWERYKNIRTQFRHYLYYSDKVNFKEIIYFSTILFFPGLLKLVKKR